jgi:flagellar assembly protein FliH
VANEAQTLKPKVIEADGQTAYQRWELPNLITADQMLKLQREAREEGFATGQREGLAAARTQTEARVAQLQSILATLNEPLSELDDRIEQELVTLAMSAAKLIVRRELKTDPGIVLAAVREAMTALPAAARNVRLHLHPEDAALVREFSKTSSDEQRWKLIEDPTVGRGGCKIITDTSRIDASIEARLMGVMATLLAADRAQD